MWPCSLTKSNITGTKDQKKHDVGTLRSDAQNGNLYVITNTTSYPNGESRMPSRVSGPAFARTALATHWCRTLKHIGLLQVSCVDSSSQATQAPPAAEGAESCAMMSSAAATMNE